MLVLLAFVIFLGLVILLSLLFGELMFASLIKLQLAPSIALMEQCRPLAIEMAV